MNEIAELRRMRRTAPLPDGDRLAGLRAPLLDAMHQDRGARRRGGPLRAGGGAVYRRAVLVTAVSALVVWSVVDSLPDDDAGHPPSTSPGIAGGVLSAEDSADTLNLAAATVEKSTFTVPGPHQWVYEKEVNLSPGIQREATWPTDHGPVPFDPSTSEEWTRWDGMAFAKLPGTPGAGRTSTYDPNELQVRHGPDPVEGGKEGDDRSQREFWGFLSTLPTDPDALMRRVREANAIEDNPHATQAYDDWWEIAVLFNSVLIPPKVQAGMYRALAKTPGVRVAKGVKDPLGRAAIGVLVHDHEPASSGSLRGVQELFLDPKTYAYLGESLAGGTVIRARAAWGVVDGPGQRP